MTDSPTFSPWIAQEGGRWRAGMMHLNGHVTANTLHRSKKAATGYAESLAQVFNEQEKRNALAPENLA